MLVLEGFHGDLHVIPVKNTYTFIEDAVHKRTLEKKVAT